MKHIVFFGDSLTAGYKLNDPVRESVPGLLQEKITQNGFSYRVSNAGLSGGTSGGGLKRLAHWLDQPIDIFVLELGINDLIRKVNITAIAENLRRIITAVKLRYPGCKLILMGMQLPQSFGQTAQAFNLMYNALAEEFQMAFVPFFLKDVAGQRHLNLADGLHPNAAGYRVIAENIWPVIEPLL